MGAKEEAREAVGLALAAKKTVNKKILSHLTLHEAVEWAMSPMDVSGAPPAPEQYVSFARIWKTVRNHPDLESQVQMTIETSTPGEVENAENQMRRRSKDALRRAIKANQSIMRKGATKAARYFYDSSPFFEKLKLIIPIVMGEIMRTPTSYNDEITFEDLMQRLSYTDINNVLSALATLEANGAISTTATWGKTGPVSSYENPIELKPGIWTFNPFGKETYNFTLSEPSSEIFADILLNLRHPDNQSKWVDMFGAIPLPEEKISKSLIVEIALWNLYHSLLHPFSTEVTAPDILRDNTARIVPVRSTQEGGISILDVLLDDTQGEPLSERDQSEGVDQSALEALADDEDFRGLVAKLTLTYLKEKKD
jgi:hypothetical protein